MGVEFSISAWDNPTAVLRVPMTVVYGPITLATAMMLARHAANMRRPVVMPERAMA
jgi:TRAP-type C4-dicarboxylate transport system permease small subunit